MTAMIKLGLSSPALAATPILQHFDWIVVSTSAGKDSQTALRHAVLEARRQRFPVDRIVAVHADLGRVEWAGVPGLARQQAETAGIEFLVVSRIGKHAQRGGKSYAKGAEFGDLLDHVERHGKWPGPATRYCTADHKRSPIRLVMSELVKRNGGRGRPFRILHVMGLRAEESPRRAKMKPLSIEQESSRRIVMRWLPIHHWTEAQVWRDIWASGIPWHEAYDFGMPRLSCSFCIFAGEGALRLAAILRPGLAADYARVEQTINHTFTTEIAIADVVRSVAGLDPVTLARRWGDDTAASWLM